MLKQRIITAVILIPLVIAAIFLLPQWVFLLLTLALTLAGAWEMSRMVGYQKKLSRYAYILLTLLVLILVTRLPVRPLLLLAAIWWLLITLRLILVERNQYLANPFQDQVQEQNPRRIAIESVNGLFVLIPCWVALYGIYHSLHGASLLMWLLVIVWSVDIGAYFTGKLFGGRHFAPTISPNKTWAGFFGGLLAGVLVGELGFNLIIAPWACFGCGAVVGLATSLFSIVGDLYESLLKRCQGLKDSGNCLPGHGGLMDRVDSLMAAAPLFALSLLGFL